LYVLSPPRTKNLSGPIPLDNCQTYDVLFVVTYHC
jgi:hypothetical protein